MEKIFVGIYRNVKNFQKHGKQIISVIIVARQSQFTIQEDDIAEIVCL